MKNYAEFLAHVDEWYRSVQAKFPDKVTCTKGCRDCCLGLFDISLADRDLLREGMKKADAATRRDIEGRAAAILEKLRETNPILDDDLDGYDAQEIDDLCDELGDVECPVLGPAGECRLYEHRPLICRLAGIPVVDVSGGVIAPEGCSKCTLKSKETPPIDYEELRRQERKFLKKIDPARSGTTLLIPQAVAPSIET